MGKKEKSHFKQKARTSRNSFNNRSSKACQKALEDQCWLALTGQEINQYGDEDDVKTHRETWKSILSKYSDGSLPIFEKLVKQNQSVRRKMSLYEYEEFVRKDAQKKYKYSPEESDIRCLIEKK